MMIELDDLIVHVSRKHIKNMYLRVHSSTGEVSISAPLKLSIDAIKNHLLTKRAWIHAARARIATRVQPRPLLMEAGEKHLFLGEAYDLVIHPGLHPKGIVIEGRLMHCFLQSYALEDRTQFLQNWYRKQMQLLLPTLIQKWEPIIGVSVQAWGIKSMKTRWGSCNVVAKRIWLNLNLIKKPLVCLEYVLVHEMVHLLEANHSKRFYAHMNRLMPQWKEHQQLLESFGRNTSIPA